MPNHEGSAQTTEKLLELETSLRGVRDSLRLHRAYLEEMVRDGGWHGVQSASDLPEGDLTGLDAAHAEIAADLRKLAVCPHSVKRLLDDIEEDGARSEVIWQAIQAGAALNDPSGGTADRLLATLGIRQPSPEHREALFLVTGRILERALHPAWLDDARETPEPLSTRLESEVSAEFRSHLASYGHYQASGSDHASGGPIAELGAKDRDRLEIDRRAAQRVSRQEKWNRRTRVEGVTLGAEPEAVDDLADLAEHIEPDALSEYTALSASSGHSVLDLPDEDDAGMATLDAFIASEASEPELELIEALREHDGEPATALRAIGDPDNWSRFQSLQRKLQRRG